MLLMRHYSMALEKNMESIEHDYGVAEEKAGNLVIAFLETNWQGWIKRAEEIERACLRGEGVAADFKTFYLDLSAELSPQHVLLEKFVTRQLRDGLRNIVYESAGPIMDLRRIDRGEEEYVESLADASQCIEVNEDFVLKAIRETLRYLVGFEVAAEKMWRFAEDVLDLDVGLLNDLGIFQRYTWFRATNSEYMFTWPRAYSQMVPEVQVEFDGRIITRASDRSAEETTELLRKIKAASRKKPRLHRYWLTESLSALCYLELDYMAEQQIAVRKCKHCGRLFLPRSVASIYCDRVVEGTSGKTCKSIGAKSTHQEKVNADAAKKLFVVVKNRIQTWVGRNRQNNKTQMQYEKWKDEVNELLREVELQNISFEEFKARIDQSPKEALDKIELTEEDRQKYKEKLVKKQEKRVQRREKKEKID